MNIYDEIKAERARQDELWGEQNHPIKHDSADDGHDYINALYTPHGYEFTASELAKQECKERILADRLDWADILLEEVCEVLDADDPKDQRTELIQVAAVAIAAVESLDRNTERPLVDPKYEAERFGAAVEGGIHYVPKDKDR